LSKKIIKNLPSKPLSEITQGDLGGARKGVVVIRYGAIGDMVMMSSVLPLLKEKYHRVTVNTTPKGYEIVKNDPNIDEFLIQEDGQIPIYEIEDYWDRLSQCFEHTVNLSESVESRLILQPDRLVVSNGRVIKAPAHEDYFKPQSEVHEKYNRNYIEETHKIAGVEFVHQPKFYTTRPERRWAERERDKIKTPYVVMIVLSGSSTHKAYPFTDSLMARVFLERDDVSFVTVGETLCQLLESGWENEPRVVRRSGIWTVRETLAFLDQVDAVIGPETGVLNAASMLPCRKIIYLSHSSVENLTKYWTNTRAISSNPECFPCHKMHNGKKYCNIDEETGAAKCAVFDPKYIIEDLNGNVFNSLPRDG